MSDSSSCNVCLRFGYSLLFWLTLIRLSHAQPGLAAEAYGEFGSLTTHKSDRTATEGPLWGGELTISRQTSGRATWQRVHGLPQMGLTLRGRNLGNPAVYGHDLSLVPFLEFNAWRTKRTILQIKHGTGFGYVSKRFDALKNLTNRLISTRFNAVSLLNIGLLLRGSDYIDMKLGVELSHESNSNIRQPNEGLNTGTLYAGLRYYPAKKLAVANPLSVNRHRRQWRAYIGMAVGMYGAENTGQLLAAPQVEALLLFQHDIRFRAIGGLEFIVPAGQSSRQLGLKIGEEVLFGHVGIRYQVGAYLHNTTNSGPIFEKIGIAYYPLPLANHVAGRFCVGTSLKAHGLRAAFVEVNAGCVF